MSTKEEDYEWTVDCLSGYDEYLDSKLPAIRSFVCKLRDDLAAKDAEIVELKAKYEMQLGAWVRDGQSIGEIASRYIALRSRIEAAPKVWVEESWRAHCTEGLCFTVAPYERGDDMFFSPVQICLVPVEEDHIVDANKKVAERKEDHEQD